MAINKNVISCTCKDCQLACVNKPGWFLPNQIKDVLDYFNASSLDDILDENILAIDWFIGDNDNVLVFAPNIVGNNDMQYPANPRGRCVFFKHNRCEIYPVRPFECAVFLHNQNKEETNKRHKWVAQQWMKSNLLDEYKDVVATSGFSVFDLF